MSLGSCQFQIEFEMEGRTEMSKATHAFIHAHPVSLLQEHPLKLPSEHCMHIPSRVSKNVSQGMLLDINATTARSEKMEEMSYLQAGRRICE